MTKTAMVRARTTPDLKADVEAILDKLGMTTSEAINIFFSQVRNHKGLPFEVKLPNKVTRETFKKTDAGKDLVKCKNFDDMIQRLNK